MLAVRHDTGKAVDRTLGEFTGPYHRLKEGKGRCRFLPKRDLDLAPGRLLRVTLKTATGRCALPACRDGRSPETPKDLPEHKMF